MSWKTKWSVVWIIIFGVCLLIAWQIKIQMADDRSALFQLREMLFPTNYSKDMTQNFKAELDKINGFYSHEQQGDSFLKSGEYEKAIEEYKTSIRIIEDSQDSIDIKTFNQKMSRYYLFQAYEKAGHHEEALEQIDWLLTHKPLPHVKEELLQRKERLESLLNNSVPSQ